MKNNFLITGGSGFIGSQAIRSLVNLGHNVHNLDLLTYASSQDSLKDINVEKYKFFKGDICNREDVVKCLELSQPHYILNFAAESHVDRSIDSSSDFIKTNINGTHCLLEESFKYWNKLKSKNKDNFKFIHISTDEVFGSLDLKGKPFNENSNIKPNSPYSASKASSDLLVRAWNKTFGLPVNITHSSNNYGPWQFPEKLIPLVVCNALNEKNIPVYGEGKNIRDWIFVEDNVEAIIDVTFKGGNGESYNIGGNSEITNIDLVNKICIILDKLNPRKNGYYFDLVRFVEDRPGHDFRYSINNKKISNDTGWKPKTNIDDGLEISIKWMIENFNWLNKKGSNQKRIGLKKL